MKRIFVVKLLPLILILASCNKIKDEILGGIGNPGPDKNTVSVSNGDFEKRIDFINPKPTDDWAKHEYIANAGIFTWGKNIGVYSTGGISLATGTTLNDIAVTQEITLDPNKFYRLSAAVKTENVSGGAGANICIYGTWNRSESVMGTTDWHLITADVPPNSAKVSFGCRLGYWGGVSTGKAYFDHLTIEELDKFEQRVLHVRLVLDREDASAVRPQTITSWLSNLENACQKYAELMQGYPYNGNVITISSVSGYPGGWAVAGNPILWYKPYIKSELQSIESTGTWSFGIMHELGHDFALDNSNKNWIFNEEMFANFRMYYVVEKLNATILEGKLYHGAELENYYKTDASGSYANGISKRIPKGYDGLMYTLVRIKNQIGWAPFIAAMKDLNASSTPQGTRWQMFNLFLDKLTLQSGQDVRSTYLQGELATIQQLTINE
jgi:hypothetical protein